MATYLYLEFCQFITTKQYIRAVARILATIYLTASRKIMEEFSLREVCNKLTSDLKKSAGDKNIVKLSIDILLADKLEGDPCSFVKSLTEVTRFVGEVLINGVINIELTRKIEQRSGLIFNVEIAGYGNRKLNGKLSTTEQLQDDIECLVNRLPYSNIGFVLKENHISFDFQIAFKPARVHVLAPSTTVAFNKRKILIVEDNKINAMVFSSFVEEWGCDIVLAVNGEEAVSIAQEQPVDLILMDIYMPVMNGITAIKKIREFNQRVPIIALTASTMEEDLRKAVIAGANENLFKPVSSTNLFQVMSKHL